MDLLRLFKRAPKPGRRKLPGRLVRGFNAAQTTRLTNGWLTSAESINSNLADSLPVLRARSREQHLNNDFVKRFVNLTKVNVVGPRGVILQARAIGQRGDLDGYANSAIEQGWAAWGKRRHCDIRERCNWLELQHQALVSAAVDGEILARHIEGTPQGGAFGYRVQLLDPELLEATYSGEFRGNRICMGVELDAVGKAVAYHFRQESHTYGGYVTGSGARYERIPAEQIIHAFIPDHIGQVRGYPWPSAALGRLKQLDAYYEAAIVNARAGASKMGFIVTPDGSNYTGDDEDGVGNQLTDFEAGIIEELPAGFQFQGWDPKYPHEQFDAFTKSILRAICGSLGYGVSYAALTGDLEGANYSSMRAGSLEEREAWKALQEWFIEAFCAPVFERWLPMALTASKLMPEPTADQRRPLPLSIQNLPRYERVAWQPRRWSWVDPSNDADASIKLIGENITTVSAVIRETGRDPDEVFEERAKEKQRLAELGLTPAEAIGGQGGQPFGS